MFKKKVILVSLIVFMANSALFAIPRMINFQGYLEKDGSPVNGNVTLIFRFYDAETNGNQLPTGNIWEETQTVLAENGIYNTNIGKNNPIDNKIFESNEVWLEIELVDVPPVIFPRQQLVSVGYSFMAEDANSLSGHTIGNLPENIPVIGIDGKLESSIIPIVTPTVSSIVPNSLEWGYSDTTITITGDNFIDVPTVKIGNTSCTNVTFVNATQITATVPGGISGSTYDVTVINPNSTICTANNSVTVGLSPKIDMHLIPLLNIGCIRAGWFGLRWDIFEEGYSVPPGRRPEHIYDSSCWGMYKLYARGASVPIRGDVTYLGPDSQIDIHVETSIYEVNLDGSNGDKIYFWTSSNVTLIKDVFTHIACNQPPNGFIIPYEGEARLFRYIVEIYSGTKLIDTHAGFVGKTNP